MLVAGKAIHKTTSTCSVWFWPTLYVLKQRVCEISLVGGKQSLVGMKCGTCKFLEQSGNVKE